MRKKKERMCQLMSINLKRKEDDCLVTRLMKSTIVLHVNGGVVNGWREIFVVFEEILWFSNQGDDDDFQIYHHENDFFSVEISVKNLPLTY